MDVFLQKVDQKSSSLVVVQHTDYSFFFILLLLRIHRLRYSLTLVI